jgi:cytochrome b561
MTSRQPGNAPQTRGVAGQWQLVLPLTLLIILGLAGLRGVVVTPRWNGPLHQYGVAIGVALEVVLIILLVITFRRRAAAQRTQTYNPVATKLREVLILAIITGMIGVVVAVLIGLHLYLFTPKTQPNGKLPGGRLPTPKPPRPGSQHTSAVHFPVAAVLYALIIVVLLAAVVLSVWWARRFHMATAGRDDGPIAEDSADLREAVESGRSALRTVDDARAAIIACYVAMETSLAERGAAREAADTPDELLARATTSGIVHSGAAGRLTALFYEARFSSHPLEARQRDAAEQALDELARALAEDQVRADT